MPSHAAGMETYHHTYILYVLARAAVPKLVSMVPLLAGIANATQLYISYELLFCAIMRRRIADTYPWSSSATHVCVFLTFLYFVTSVGVVALLSFSSM